MADQLIRGAGQKTAADSMPVVLASDHGPIAVTISGAGVDLTVDIDASNLATHADAVAGNASLTSLDGKLTSGAQKTQVVGSAAAAIFPDAAALGDSDTNPTTTKIGAALIGWTGSAFKRLLNGLTTPGSTFTGLLNTIPWAKFDLSPTTRTTGQGGPLQAEADGSLRTSMSTRIAGEDIASDVLKVRDNYLHAQITGITAGTTVKSSPGFIHAVQVGAPVATSVVTIYDNTSAAGTILWKGTLAAGNPFSVLLNKTCVVGIFVVVATLGCDLGVSYA